MKISINNFKSIGSVVDYELKPMTILSGNNSSGKSSFIQLLLLLKQTIDIDSAKYSLYLDGNYYRVKDYTDIIREKNKRNKLAVSFAITKQEFQKYGERIEESIFDGFPDYTCSLKLSFDFLGDDLYIKEFLLSYAVPEKNNFVKFTQDKNIGGEVSLESNNEYFIKSNADEIPVKYFRINYSSIFPTSIEVIRFEKRENTRPGKPLLDETKTNEYPNLNPIKSYFRNFFGDLFYIGPLRTEPRDSYPSDSQIESVGVKGEHVAPILTKRQGEEMTIFLPSFGSDGIKFRRYKRTLLQATNFWICQVFRFGKRIYTKENGENISIILVNHSGIEATIKHVGFGISQVLPIIVQGLLLEPGSTLVLEQPEIHLHPKIQSLLFDFLHSLLLKNINIVIETHSDHFITRMRRRIAEEDGSKLKDQINLTFIESGQKDLIFKTLDLDEFGSFNYFPEEFIERPDIELKALIKAQMKKRTAKKI